VEQIAGDSVESDIDLKPRFVRSQLADGDSHESMTHYEGSMATLSLVLVVIAALGTLSGRFTH
jgi:hypothetical protein